MTTPEAQSEAGWESWSEPSDFIMHKNERVDVRKRNTGTIILENALVSLYTDLTGTAAILEHGTYGEDTSGESVVGALNLPPLPSYDFRIDQKKHRAMMTNNRIDPRERTQSEIAKWENKYREWASNYEFRVVG